MAELSLQSIRQLLLDSPAQFHDVAVKELLNNIPQSSALAIEYLLSCREANLQSYAHNLIRRLPFLRNCFGPPLTDRECQYKVFAALAAEFRVFMDSIYEVASGLAESKRDLFLSRLSLFPGIRHDVGTLVEKLWGHNESRRFADLTNRTMAQYSSRQLMLFVTYRCNLRCPYCFAGDLSKVDMPADQALRFIARAQDDGINMVTFCGGEPTIYPYFPHLLDEIRRRNMKTYFATNLLAGPDVLDRIRPDYVCTLIVHVAHKHVYKGEQWDAFRDNIRIVRGHNVPVSLRINIYSQGHDWTHLFDLTETFGLGEVHLAFAFPNVSGTNKYVNIEDIKPLIPELLGLMDRCEAAGLRTVFSKPVPLCFFGEQLGSRLLWHTRYTPRCSVFENNFTRNVCISPEGNLSPCLGMLDVSRAFVEFPERAVIEDYCRSHILPALETAVLPQCCDCFLYHRRICQGLCLGHKRQVKSVSCH